MIEGLLPGLVAARRTLAAQLQQHVVDGGDSGDSALLQASAFERYGREWLQHEALRLGCPADMWASHVNSVAGRFSADDHPMLGLPLELCPTCCSAAIGRLQVVMLRN